MWKQDEQEMRVGRAGADRANDEKDWEKAETDK